MSATQTSHAVATWLLLLYLMVFAMVIVGGATRLTGSGLSMVEWHPLMGALPPVSESDWTETFQKYQASPQYQLVNHWMVLSDFKRIFLWEYAHRLLGRLIGVVFLVPWLFFLIRRSLDKPLAWKTFVAFLLGGAQGLLGWFMVKSGLVDNPEVSHYRLAAHLGLALVVGHYLLWLFLDVRRSTVRRSDSPPRGASNAPTWSFIALLALQIVFGALMAGKRAGLVAPTFPDMNGQWIPSTFLSIEPWWRDLLENPMSIHFVHRWFGAAVLLSAIGLACWVHRASRTRSERSLAWLLAGLTVLQFALGALVVLWLVPLHAAIAHQACAFMILSVAVALAHRMSLDATVTQR
jgi:cytochrome c oxidase assembly protein subunit 15